MIYPIIPKPQKISVGDITVFTLTKFCELENAQAFAKAANRDRKSVV